MNEKSNADQLSELAAKASELFTKFMQTRSELGDFREETLFAKQDWQKALKEWEVKRDEMASNYEKKYLSK